jgi:hypothetical protein
MMPKLAMIDLLQKRRHDDYEDMSLMFILGVFFKKYRPQSSIEMPWEERRREIFAAARALLSAIPYSKDGDIVRTKVLASCIRFYFDGDVLRHILKGIRGSIVETLFNDAHNESVLHEAISRRLLERDPLSMTIIMQKTQHFHILRSLSHSDLTRKTPTMLTMYDPHLFLAWRTMLRDLKRDIQAFVYDELQYGMLRATGWNEHSLAYLFQADLTSHLFEAPRTYTFGFPLCQRCGHNGTTLGSHLKVDLGWRRYLRAVRRHYSGSITKDNKPVQSNLIVSDESSRDNSVRLSESRPISLPYHIVCSTACIDGVCVAWLYENDSHIEPDLPQYPYVEPVQSHIEKDMCFNMRIPGAFLED